MLPWIEIIVIFLAMILNIVILMTSPALIPKWMYFIGYPLTALAGGAAIHLIFTYWK